MSVLIELVFVLAVTILPRITGQTDGLKPVSNNGSDSVNSTKNSDFDCQEGYLFSLTDNHCLDVNECSMQPDPCQAQNMSCINLLGSFLCYDPASVTPLENTVTTTLPSSSRPLRTTPGPTEKPTTKTSSKNNNLGLNHSGLNHSGLNLGLGLVR